MTQTKRDKLVLQIEGWAWGYISKNNLCWVNLNYATDGTDKQKPMWLQGQGFDFRYMVDCVWNVMAHAKKPDFVFRRKGWVHLNRRGCQFSRLLVVEVCASAVIMLDTPCSEAVWRVPATHSLRQFPLHFPSRASPCAITFQLDSTSEHFETGAVITICFSN